MFNFLKRKKIKDFVINCDTDTIIIDEKELSFPTSFGNLVEILGKPTRVITKSHNYAIWDDNGFFCGYTDENNILSINIYQNKKDSSEYNTKKQFNGQLFLNDEEITNSEFGKISIGKYAIHRLGSENEIRFGFSLGINKDYKTS